MLILSLVAAGCQENKKGSGKKRETESTQAASAVPTPNSPVTPGPDINVCDKKIKEDPNIAKYPQAPKANIQRILNKFPGAETAIKTFAGNGCRETVIFIPKGFDRGKPIELQYHFHGSFGNFIGMPVPYDTKLVKKGGYGKADMRIEQALTALSYQERQGRRNTILVYPLSAGRREGGDEFAYQFAYDDFWMKKGNDTNDSMTVLDFDVRNELQSQFGINTDGANITLSGHSSGGRAIMHAIESGFIPDKIKFLEASYNDWALRTWQKLHESKNQVPMDVYFKPGMITENPANALHDKENVKIMARPNLEHGQFVELL